MLEQKKEYVLEADAEYPKELHKNRNELPFLAERMKIGKVEKLVPSKDVQKDALKRRRIKRRIWYTSKT